MEARARALVPGTPITPPLPLVRYQLSHLTGVYRAFVDAATQPNDVVLVIGASTGTPVAEAVSAGRRVLALYRNPIELLRAHLDLAPCSADQVGAALTQLGDLSKAGRPLIAHLNSQYASRCPQCNTLGVAEWFAWERDSGKPYAKRVACRRCATAHEGPVDDEDLTLAGTFPVRSGPAYHLALSRAPTLEDSPPERVSELVQLYTPRNLTAVMDILYRLPQLRLPQNVNRVIIALFLETLDRCSSLTSASAPEERPRSLHPPQRFVEQNVWMALEHALDAYGHTALAASSTLTELRPTPASSLEGLLASEPPGYLLLGQSVHDVANGDISGRIGALLWEIHPPDAAYWAQSVLWASWVWGENLPAGLRGFLHRRRLDWDWYRRSMVGALKTLRPLMAERAPILIVSPAHTTAALRAVQHAVNEVGLTVDRWIVSPPLGYRLLLHFDNTPSGSRPTAQSGVRISEQALQARGEPTPQQTLQDIGVVISADPDLPELSVGSGDPLTQPAGDLLWLKADAAEEVPLADRVEAWLVTALTVEARWRRVDLIGALYGAFDGVQSPEPELIEAVIDAYTQVDPEGYLAFRDEDEPDHRHAEVQLISELIQSLGLKLGYTVEGDAENGIFWKESAEIHYLFRCTTTAELGPHLLGAPPGSGQRCLVIPGGRAALVALKLRRDPRLEAKAREQDWIFIKYRHIRRIVERVENRDDIAVFLGLDPIVEQPSAQLALPL